MDLPWLREQWHLDWELKMTTNDRRFKHGGAIRKARAPEYNCWVAMRQRCENPKDPDYKHYGGRGIAVCDRWTDYAGFISDMGKKPSREHSIERRDNERGYSPKNCYWGTKQVQCNNQRRNLFLEFNGEKLTIGQWEHRLGFKKSTIASRLRCGWPVERALSEAGRALCAGN